MSRWCYKSQRINHQPVTPDGEVQSVHPFYWTVNFSKLILELNIKYIIYYLCLFILYISGITNI